MKFIITRTSSSSKGKHAAPPYPEAKLEGEHWVIELDDLEDLIAFNREVFRNNQSVIFDPEEEYNDQPDPYPRIEIWDDYRE